MKLQQEVTFERIKVSNEMLREVTSNVTSNQMERGVQMKCYEN